MDERRQAFRLAAFRRKEPSRALSCTKSFNVVFFHRHSVRQRTLHRDTELIHTRNLRYSSESLLHRPRNPRPSTSSRTLTFLASVVDSATSPSLVTPILGSAIFKQLSIYYAFTSTVICGSRERCRQSRFSNRKRRGTRKRRLVSKISPLDLLS